MKIHHLRFKNLNSLYGEWHIDFTLPGYSAEGLFAITGATGAGKSTILDAICLALYAQTPRLSRINQSANEIMSRHTGECYAEVEFSTAQGLFRCHWGQHRARKKAEGKLNQAKHEIAELRHVGDEEALILANKLKDVERLVEEKTGMDFQRFTRSMMLAQGSFASFLQASADERAPILEQITGTEIYSEISKLTHQHHKQEKEKLQSLQQQLGHIALLSAEEQSALVQQQEVLQQQVSQRVAQQEQLRQGIVWHETLQQLQQEGEQLKQQQVQLQQRLQASERDKVRLRRAEQAMQLDVDFMRLVAVREQRQGSQQRLQKNQAEELVVKQRIEQYQTRVNEAQAQQEIVQRQWQQEQHLMNQVRELDVQLREQAGQVQQAQQVYQTSEKKLAALQADYESNQQDQQQLSQQLAEQQYYLQRHAPDASLVTELAGIRGQLGIWQEQQQALESLNKQRQSNQQTCEQALKHVEQQQRTVDKAQQQQQRLADDLAQAEQGVTELLAGRLKREHQAQLGFLHKEREYRRKIASYEQERQRLIQGEACPLCGALAHPFATTDIPVVDEVEQQLQAVQQRLQTLDEQEQHCRSLQQSEQQAVQQLLQAQSKYETAVLKRTQSQQQQQQIEQQHQAIQAKVTVSEQQLQQQLGIYIPDWQQQASDKILSQLEQRVAHWQSTQQQQQRRQQALGELQGMAEQLQAQLNTVTDESQQHQRYFIQIQQQYIERQQQRYEVYGEQSLDEQEQHWQQRLEQVETQTQQAAEILQQSLQQLYALEREQQRLQEILMEQTLQQQTLQHAFEQRLQHDGFGDESTWQAACLSLEQRSVLQQQLQTLHDEQQRQQALQQAQQQRLQDEQSKALTQETLSALQQQSQALQQQWEAEQAQLVTVNQRLQQHENSYQQQQQHIQNIERQRHIFERWDKLHELIGSADGKRYRNFAQGLTFKVMVAHANQQLQKITDRYLLCYQHDDKQPLALSVLDQYQAGEVRSTKNLSGGESFMVSLALALGLSSMASRRVRVDSLFLDEGFGTLDVETLEVALDALANLHQEGKLIGVISHVSALQERIHTRIQVNKLSGGRSRLVGVGCSQL